MKGTNGRQVVLHVRVKNEALTSASVVWWYKADKGLG